MKKLLFALLMGIISTLSLDAHLVSLETITNYISTFSIVRELSEYAKQDISQTIMENMNEDFAIEDNIAKALLFDAVNASTFEIELFETILTDQDEELAFKLQCEETNNNNENNNIIEYDNDWQTTLKNNYTILNTVHVENYNKISGTTLEIPTMPTELFNKPIVQLVVNRQQGQSCGYHAVINAWALQNNTSEPVSLRSYFTENQELYLPQIYDNEVIEFANKVGLDQYAILQMNQRDKIVELYACKNRGNEVMNAETNFYAFEYLNANLTNSIIELIENNQYANFLCCSGYHWTTFTIAKSEEGFAYIIFMNSTAHPDYFNGPIENHLTEYKFAETLLEAVEIYNNGGLV